ncbi:MAG: diguanylate cyclase [Sulfurimonas sp. RIFOXYD12_FULL_33_39]|uniref:EAL domain-containing protein n=1 Tax=unclassified Sulfurimonas TaxID=2623549 RepID=UPI0008B52405|nr:MULTISPECIES: EAL domain-containing protein [unclassified Sulfurimonas]OHE06638.1 MAG: diguanylate cyclase [Sulfurimonas sp. RIFCSPLOWO2_12_FULL_34_6]OHE10461.1 MAG: diguanylate cyclase [Sulfurimonas sp. RIFOXYD12_FULL_33_39]OHE14920.1 MAG: diguanylate cyclase [Sulfurimonas sp. RIFOXYD2_FULL_34_21]DAB27804.1 MAG TPA: diguanylate cyclase [Sulfurimonas sp. UBA10385]
MYKLNSKILKLIPVIFLLVATIKVTYTYFEIKNREADFAKKEAEVLNSYAIENRVYYQKLFLDGTLNISEKTLSALPAFSSHIISDNFSKNNPLNITVRTVSDRARNSKNQANADEMKAIEFFKKNLEEERYFSDENSKLYQFGSVLRVEPICLKCHGDKNDAPSFIQSRYNEAYGYKLGEVRGIISIQIPTKNLNSYFFKNFIKSIFYDLFIFLLLFLGVSYLTRESKALNISLEEKIKAKTKELKDSFFYERLTGLPNRLKLIDDIEQNKNSKFSHLALINIDSFKDINDLYGYEVGDELLIEISKQVEEFCSGGNYVYKFPNDEFAIFTTSEISEDTFYKTIKNLIDKISEAKFEIANQSIFVSFSCGIASNKIPLLIKANSALQIAKKHSKNIVVYHSSFDAKEKITKNIDALLLLKDAILHDWITPYYQPIYNTRTKKIEKYESLARIVTDDGRVIAPFAFLDISVKSKLYPEITRAMIRKSFEFFKDKNFEFSINISIADIQNPDTVKFIANKLQEFNQSQRVVFEILEGDKIENYEEIKSFIKDVKKYGCKIAIDDFGSGYSNFSHILELNVDFLKIDSSLVKFVTTDENSRVVVKTIINFASNLGLRTIAEYVEDKDALDLLEKMGVDFVQGYYIGRPEKELVNYQ